MARRVVITGMGAICPVGKSVTESFNNLIAGNSGIDTIPAWVNAQFNNQPLGVTVGGAVKDFNPEEFGLSKKDTRRMGRFIHLAIAASNEAWQMAHLQERLDESVAKRAGCIIGVGLMGMDIFCANYDVLKEKGPRRVSPFFIPGTISNLAPGQIAINRNLKLDNWTVVSACASGNHAIGEAFHKIKSNDADLMVAGGAESAMHPLSVAGFHSMHALCASKNDNPKKASRPFDKTRDGFVMGEGAGILVLEELEHAKKRGAEIIAEVIGYGSTCDANHITAPAESGEGAMRAMKKAIDEACVDVNKIDYINAHGTSTPLNDKFETQAIKAVFKDYAKDVSISSTKSMTGHLLGAAGGIEAVFTALSIKYGKIPPTLNLDHPDDECDLDYTANESKTRDIKIALSNSFGFGGANSVIALRKFE